MIELLQKAGEPDFLRLAAKAVLQMLMEADVEGLIGAGLGEQVKTDAHWNDAGAPAVSAALIERLGTRFHALPPLSPERFAFGERTAPGGDLAEMLYLERELPETVVEAVPLDLRRARPAEPRG